MNELRCRFCGVECASYKAKEGHEALCDKNPLNVQVLKAVVSQEEVIDSIQSDAFVSPRDPAGLGDAGREHPKSKKERAKNKKRPA